MTKVTYVGDAELITWCGVTFKPKKTVKLDSRKGDHRHILSRVPTNPFFELEGGAKDAQTVNDELAERDELRKALDEKGISYHHKHGVEKLRELLESAPDEPDEADYPDDEEETA